MLYKLGYFTDEVEAAKAYNAKAKELSGEFVWLNPLPEEINQDFRARDTLKNEHIDK